MVGETSAILPVIDEHSHSVNAATVIVEATKVANHSHNAHAAWKAPSILGVGEMDNLAILGRMRQRYESMMEYQDEYPGEGTKLSWPISFASFGHRRRIRNGIRLGFGCRSRCERFSTTRGRSTSRDTKIKGRRRGFGLVSASAVGLARLLL